MLQCPACGVRLTVHPIHAEKLCPRCLLREGRRIAMIAAVDPVAPEKGSGGGRTSSPCLRVSVKRRGGLITISLAGELDLSSVEIARAELLAAESEPALREIVLDLEQLEFIDSSGIAWLIDAGNRSRASSNRLRVRGVRPQVLRVLELTGVAERLQLAD